MIHGADEPGTTVFSPRDYALLAAGWDAAVAAMRYEDGTPVEIAASVNPYRRDTP